METISHYKVRSLLEAATNHELTEIEQLALEAHLANCKECTEFSKNIMTLKTSLSLTLHSRWDNHIPKLSVAEIKKRAGIVSRQNRAAKLVGRMAVIPVITLLYVLAFNSTWQQNQLPTVSAMSPNSSGVPLFTPSPLSMGPRSNPTECRDITYFVKVDDTLSGIATRFGISKAALLKYNHLTSEVLYTSMELSIPLCENTTMDLTTTPTTTSTFAPMIETRAPISQE